MENEQTHPDEKIAQDLASMTAYMRNDDEHHAKSSAIEQLISLHQGKPNAKEMVIYDLIDFLYSNDDDGYNSEHNIVQQLMVKHWGKPDADERLISDLKRYNEAIKHYFRCQTCWESYLRIERQENEALDNLMEESKNEPTDPFLVQKVFLASKRLSLYDHRKN